MTEGSTVFLKSSAGEIERILVQDMGDILLICRKEEWERAMAAHESPIAVGFKRTDLIRQKPPLQ